VIALHNIADADGFWAAAGPPVVGPQAGLTLRSMLAEQVCSKSVCVWKAGSVESVRTLVEGAVGAFGQDEHDSVAAAPAMGLPRASTVIA
jgi:hypothetical protein